MGIAELVLIAAGLAMDAFAVSVCKGLAMKTIDRRQTVLIGVFFGGFQALMPIIGWLLGTQFEKYITSFDHWIAFALLSFIGGKMIWESCSDKEETPSCPPGIRELLVLAVATSIDALAVGITFAFLKVNIWLSAALIGIITLALSVVGVMIGNRFGSRYKSRAELAGGIILVLIGIKILMEHLGVI